jgi:hypothetical protein
MPAQLFEGVGHLQHDAAAHQTALERERAGQNFPGAIDLADDVFQGDANVIVEDIGKRAVIHRARRLDHNARRIHRDDEHADAGVRRLDVLVGTGGKKHVFAPPGRGPDLLAVDDPVLAVPHRAGARAARSEPAWGSL